MTGKKIRKKKLLIASLVSGLLNAGYGYVLYLVAPPPTFTYRGGTGGAGFTGGGAGAAARAAASSGGELVFVISSFLAGFLLVLVTIGIALVYARYRKKSDEEPEESSEHEESAEPEESEALDLDKPPK